jgi:predicted Zn-dependent protease
MDELSYRAAAFHPEFEGGRGTGTIVIRSDGVRFEGEGRSVRLPWQGLEMKAGGASDRLLFFSHPTHREWSVYTDDRSILKNPEIRSHLPAEIRTIGRNRARGLGVVLAVLLTFVVAGWGLLQLKDPLVGAVAKRVPLSVEQKIGEVALRQITLTSSTISDQEIADPLKRLLERVARGAPGSRYNFRLHVMEDESVNAFALPGGPVVLNTGLILKATSPEEIAGVLGHEIAHVTRQHSVKQLISSLGVFAIVQAMFGDVSGIAAVLIDGGANLVTMGFSRDAEREADEAGLQYLERARIDPAGMVSFFRKLREEEGASGSEALTLISTHPATAERIRTLETLITSRRAGQRFEPLDTDLEALKKAIRARQERRKDSDAGGG